MFRLHVFNTCCYYVLLVDHMCIRCIDLLLYLHTCNNSMSVSRTSTRTRTRNVDSDELPLTSSIQAGTWFESVMSHAWLLRAKAHAAWCHLLPQLRCHTSVRRATDQVEPLVRHYLYNAYVPQRWRMMWQVMVILNTTNNARNEWGRIRQAALDKQCHPNITARRYDIVV